MRCPLCGNSKDLIFLESRHAKQINYDVYACPECSLSFSEPMRPADAGHYEIVEWYGKRWEFEEALNFFAGKTGKILEIGCGKGYFLSLAQKQGFKAVGIDFNSKAIASAKKKFGIDRVYAWSLEDFVKQFPSEKFEIVCFFHVLEHLQDPVAFLNPIKNILEPGGHIVFSFPNPNRIDIATLNREPWDYPPHHLTRWNEKSVETLLKTAGFIMQHKDCEPLTVRKTTESIGTFLQAKLSEIVNRQKTGAANKPGTAAEAVMQPNEQTKLFFSIKAIIKPLIITVLLPFGIILYAVGKCRSLTGQAMMVIAKLEDKA